MPHFYEFELGKASDVLCRELFELKPGETFTVTADTESDPDVRGCDRSGCLTCDAATRRVDSSPLAWARTPPNAARGVVDCPAKDNRRVG